jgi:4-amino-4-deoxy-L-arabinose transferase-like glycosyltransferase
MTRAREWFSSLDGRWLIAVFAVALAIRLFVAITITPSPRDGRFDDSVFYDTAARHMADGKGYAFDPNVWYWHVDVPVFPGETELTPTALWPPGWPITLAGIYYVTDDSMMAGRLANALFGAMTVALVYLIALRLFDRVTGVFSALCLAFMPAHILFTSILMSESYFGFLLALTLALCVYFVFPRGRPPNLLIVGVVGVLIAWTGLVRGEFTMFGVLLAAILLWQYKRQAVVPLAALAIGAVLVLGPWTVRNRVTMGEWLPGTTGSGRVTFQGHNDRADGGPSIYAVGDLEGPFAGLPRKEIELQSNRKGRELAREWAWDHKTQEIKLVGLRMWKLFRNDEAGVTWLQTNRPWFGPENAERLIVISTFAFYGLIAMTLMSLPIWFRWRDPRMWAVFAVFPLYIVTFGVLFIGDPRYHYALYIPLAIFGGVGFAALWRITVARWDEVFGQRHALEPLPGVFGGASE